MSLTRPVSCVSDAFYYYCFFFLINLLELISFDKFYIFGDDSDDDGSGSGSPGTCTFLFCSGNSVGCVSDVGSGIFVPTGIELIGDVFPLVVLVPRGVESKGGRPIELFRHPTY